MFYHLGIKRFNIFEGSDEDKKLYINSKKKSQFPFQLVFYIILS